MLRAASCLRLVSQHHCNTSCKESMLRAATCLRLVSQHHCNTSCKEGMLRAATCLRLIVSQHHCNTSCKEKLHRLTLSVELDSTFCNDCRGFLKPLQVVARNCNVFSDIIASCSPRKQRVTCLLQVVMDSFFQVARLAGRKIARCNASFKPGLHTVAASSAGATWLSILSILILCVAPARFLNQEKKSGGWVNKYKKNII